MYSFSLTDPVNETIEGKLISYSPGSLTVQYTYITYDGNTTYYSVLVAKPLKIYIWQYSSFFRIVHHTILPPVESYHVNLTTGVKYRVTVIGDNKYMEYPKFLVDLHFTINDKNEIQNTTCSFC